MAAYPLQAVDMTSPLADPELRKSLFAAVARRVPAQEVEEIVQSALVEALASQSRPEDEGELRRWLFGVARNKVVDFHRRRGREGAPIDAADLAAEDQAQNEAIDLLRWAEREAPDGAQHARTLEWMLREGDGEKLEDIARAESLPAPQVRQRVARMRRHYRTRWAVLAAAAAVGGALAFVLWLQFRDVGEQAQPAPAPSITAPLAEDPLKKAVALRTEGLALCAKGAWDDCLLRLDQAAKLDPAGDKTQPVTEARAAAASAKAPPPPLPDFDEKQKQAPPPVKPTAPKVDATGTPTGTPTATPMSPTAPPTDAPLKGPSKKMMKPGPKSKAETKTEFE